MIKKLRIKQLKEKLFDLERVKLIRELLFKIKSINLYSQFCLTALSLFLHQP